MGKIFYLMGKSSSGKDTIYKALLSNKELNLKKIIPYTTRPIRDGEQDGVEYFFTNEEGLAELVQKKAVIEQRAYNTFYGVWKYFTVFDKQIDLVHNNYLIIGTPESFAATKDYFGNDKVVPILIELDDGIRLQRAIDREKSQPSPKYEEMCRRFLADAVDFSEEKLRHAKIEKRFYNHELETCLEEIEAYMRSEIKG